MSFDFSCKLVAVQHKLLISVIIQTLFRFRFRRH